MLINNFKYVLDSDLKTDAFLSIKRGRPEQWVSRHVELANKDVPIEGDCDDYTMTGIQCSLILGVNPSRIAAVAVVSDPVIRRSMAIKPQIDHLIGGFFNGQDWLACFDTLNEDRAQPYLAKIGSGRRIPANDRHSGQLIAIANQGFRWRMFPESWYRFSES